MPLLTLNNVSVSRGEKPVLHDVSFTLNRAETLLIQGDNGAGKSTLLRAIAGLCPLDKGEIQRNSAVSWLSHHNALKLSLTVCENLTLLRPASSQRLMSSLDSLGLSDLSNTVVRHLSAGQQRRVAFARLLLNDAPLWLLDEPTTSMDRHHSARVEALIAHHCQQGGAVILVSHTTANTPYQKSISLSAHHRSACISS